jgi:hypothetical protein
MAEKLVSPGALDKLAKLLAAENIAVEHAPVVTASFDVKNRVLRLPMWQEMTESLYHLLVLHEVGHALETPCDGWKGAIDAVEESDGRRVSRTFQGYLNVVEDARIERKIKAKFPGSRRDFHDGYKWLYESDFFNVKSTKPDELSTIDRINLYFKVGAHMQVPFSTEKSLLPTCNPPLSPLITNPEGSEPSSGGATTIKASFIGLYMGSDRLDRL